MSAVAFDRDSHTYRVGARVLPSVTEILRPWNNFSCVPRELLESARQFGSHVHQACDLYNRNALDWSTLDEGLTAPVTAWAQFLADSGAVPITSEEPLAHEQLGYAGTPDTVVDWKGPAVIDIKSTAYPPPCVGLQTAAYARLIQVNHSPKRPPRRYCITVDRDGSYKVFSRTECRDWSWFQSALNLHHFLRIANDEERKTPTTGRAHRANPGRGAR